MPKAPALFSTTKDWPSSWRIWSPTTRLMMSVAPPGAYGRRILTGLLGYLSCARACGIATARLNNEARIRPNFFIWFPLGVRRRMCVSRGLEAVQAVRGILHGEEHDVGLGRRLAGMDRVRRDVEHRAGLGLE